jgi:asparagine synthase (glutamine-hydrolysing)
MCGICGELGFGGRPASRETLARMCETLEHRGPDGSGAHCRGSLALGHRRLAIIDLSPAGAQPMWSADRRRCIVFNGEIYNFRELRGQLEAAGLEFSSESDTEVILEAIGHWGLDTALSRFIGMFAFGLWDEADRSLTLCRDRVGVKPLYYMVTQERVCFGSELRALYVHPAFERELDPAGLSQFFVSGQALNPYTIFRGVREVIPGHYIVFDEGGQVRDSCYWSLDSVGRNDRWTGLEDAAEELEDLMASAFAYRLVSDVPVGLFLSGGIDSSLVSAVLSQREGADLLNITVGFDEEAFDEAPVAAETASRLGVRHQITYLDPATAQRALHQFHEVYDLPFGDTSGIPTRILCETAREHVKVALSADGGDELFCGYDSYGRYTRGMAVLSRLPQGFRRLAAGALRHAVPYRWLLDKLTRGEHGTRPQAIGRFEKLTDLLRVGGTGDLVRAMYEKAWAARDVHRLLGGLDQAVFDGTAIGGAGPEPGRADLLDAMLRADFSVFLRDDILTKVDRASMSVSLECRDPMLDHRLVEFAFSLPLEYLSSSEVPEKRILRHLLRSWLPPSVVNAPKKGFSIPLYKWLRGPWREATLDYLSEESVRRVGVLDVGEVRRQVDRFYRYRGERAERIWMMLSFQMWAYRWYLK